jgi:hypothetical protein
VSVAFGVALPNLITTLVTVQAMAVASCERAATVEAAPQQEQAAMEAAAATTSGAATAPVDLAAALAALQACVVAVEAEAQQA